MLVSLFEFSFSSLHQTLPLISSRPTTKKKFNKCLANRVLPQNYTNFCALAHSGLAQLLFFTCVSDLQPMVHHHHQITQQSLSLASKVRRMKLFFFKRPNCACLSSKNLSQANNACSLLLKWKISQKDLVWVEKKQNFIVVYGKILLCLIKARSQMIWQGRSTKLYMLDEIINWLSVAL